jgi:hypothetical protein
MVSSIRGLRKSASVFTEESDETKSREPVFIRAIVIDVGSKVSAPRGAEGRE